MKQIRKELIQELPFVRPDSIIRICERSDMDLLRRWPSYPHPYGSFNFSFTKSGSVDIDSLFRTRQCDENRITLVADRLSARSIGYIALMEINWERRRCGNMGVRVHPEWCGKGFGTEMLTAVRIWWFRAGMQRLCLDVASSNERAIRCYRKVGFTVVGEFWRTAADLRGVNLDDSNWYFLKDHIRNKSQNPELRFLLMELKRETEQKLI